MSFTSSPPAISFTVTVPKAQACPQEGEELQLDAVQQQAYQRAQSYLQAPVTTTTTFLVPLFSVVPVHKGLPSLQEEAEEQGATSTHEQQQQQQFLQQPLWFASSAEATLRLGSDNSSTASSSSPPQLQHAVAALQGLEKKEQTLVEKSVVAQQLTRIILGHASENVDDATTTTTDATSTTATTTTTTTGTEQQQLHHHSSSSSSSSTLQQLAVLGQAVPRRVCQHPFRKNDIVWVCRTCQADETCVLCHACFSQSQHEGHDINFYHAQAGGCCDCGDPDAWDPTGFCPHHGPASSTAGGSAAQLLPPNLVHRVRGVVPAVVDWMVHTIAANALRAYSRTITPRPVLRHETMNDNDDDDDDDDEINDNDSDDRMMLPHFGFDPTAASTPRTLRTAHSTPTTTTTTTSLTRPHHPDQPAQSLGKLGAEQGGLYLVVHADDIHLKHQVVEAFRYFWGMFLSDMLLNKLADALQLHGQLIVWGTAADLIPAVGRTAAALWWDGDAVACATVAQAVLEKAARLQRHGMFCSILTHTELLLEQRAVVALQWLSAVARSCDPLCQTVAESILPNRHLVPLLQADFKMSSRCTKAWYSLLLTLLAVPTFKSHLAAAYCDTYRDVTAKYASGMGVLERSGYTLSVQFLNRVAYVIDLVQGRDLLGKLGKSLLDTLTVATRSRDYNGRLNSNHFVLAHRRYSPCVSDLKCVLNVAGMPRVTACAGGSFLGDWIEALSVAQSMDPQTWRHWSQGHVEEESRGWVGAFNASISLGSLFERLLGWKDDDESPIKDPSSPLSKDLMSCVELTVHVLIHGVAPWQKLEMNRDYTATPFSSDIPPHKRASASLPFSTVAAASGTALAMRQLPVSQVTPFSFHLPLHRFVASALRELCLRPDDAASGMSNLMQRLSLHEETADLFWGLMEYPVLVLSRVAQVRSDLWKHNGPGLNDQVLNYAEPPFCRNMRDADLLMTQFAVMGRTQHLALSSSEDSVGMAFLSNLLLHRFGIFDFCGLCMAPTSNVDRYRQEWTSGLYPKEIPALGPLGSDLALPWTYSAARDPSSFMKLLEEFLRFIVVFISELPHVVPTERDEQIRQAKFRLHREVIHRLASGPKTHSELSEVHHVLSHSDNALLNEEGRLLNPDDATGAALGVVLADVADRRVTRSGRPEPDKWELRDSAWESYDPAFFHISLRSHQTAAESRPKPKASTTNGLGWEPKPFAPKPTRAHPFFERLRRDATCDATIIAVTYKVLHLHCRKESTKDLSDLRGKSAYESKEMSETALTRAVHLLTLGVYAWSDARRDDINWKRKGGASAGSLFYNRMDDESAPTAADWIEACLLRNPRDLLDCDWYEDEENLLVLLHRLALNGGTGSGFAAQDTCVRAGAAWLCSFASSHCAAAASMFAPEPNKLAQSSPAGKKTESETDRRKRLAKEKALARIQAQAARFATKMEVELGASEDETDRPSPKRPSVSTPNRPIRTGSFGSTLSSASSVMTGESDVAHVPSFVSLASEVGNIDLANFPPRLLQTRPRCIICNDEESSESRAFERMEHDDGEGQRKKSRKKENALGFVGYSQASTVLKGGGGPPPDLVAPPSPAREFVGTHIALCGHAVHSECCESYLATVSHREDRAIGKRDEFRCPLCQRLSNCLVPFIDVGLDWIDSPTCLPVAASDRSSLNAKTDGPHPPDEAPNVSGGSPSLHTFLYNTSWWLTRRNDGFVWDGHSAFVERVSSIPVEIGIGSEDHRKPARKMRSLKKKDLYAAWNAMMRTRRFVRRKLRSRSTTSHSSDTAAAAAMADIPGGEDSSGETLVWRRFMDQVADISYKADSKRLGDVHLHMFCGEFRHFVVERYAYSTSNLLLGRREATDWPSCMFDSAIPDPKRQEMSREKLLSKLLMSIQAFAYSCCCEGFEAKRACRKSRSATTGRSQQDNGVASVLSRFGTVGIDCDGHLILLPHPSADDDGGLQPFNGRLGKLRYLGLAILSAAGALSADLVQIVLPFPVEASHELKVEHPDRAPIAYPILLGHVLTHVVAAFCATCGRARAESDSINMWQVPLTPGCSAGLETAVTKRIDLVASDCDGFLKLGLLARTLQVLLKELDVPSTWISNTEDMLSAWRASMPETIPDIEKAWMVSCLKLLKVAMATFQSDDELWQMPCPDDTQFAVACGVAADAAVSFMSDIGTILQILVPGIMARYSGNSERRVDEDLEVRSSCCTLERLCTRFRLERMDEMLESSLVKEVVANWCSTALNSSAHVNDEPGSRPSLLHRLNRTQGFRGYDWPSPSVSQLNEIKAQEKDQKFSPREQPHDDSPSRAAAIERELSPRGLTPSTDVRRRESTRAFVTFSSKKSVPLLGGFSAEAGTEKGTGPRIAAIPTSYTDLYAELGALMPDSEQTAVCLICGAVLSAGGKGDCTLHSYRCGAGAGMFFLLQECSGLIMHKSKAAYIHSPYVDSHGETPQYRGRPLNLDLDRYDHLREVWFGHGVRQQVVAERGSSRQVILPDFY